ncbi:MULTISPECIES: hypothetical protein [unclassified Pseudoalteromonas]|uniref:hypothetical protein n=1 Tax=unclassified Pseudoalteromonas TaxID=194690 RepID=UPI001D413942|nr:MULTISPECIES: hypothetical protein [unclassified Pseudoalteromonas]MDC9508828.1 hypothetical protein [Pseudoalteromonas sp. Angola-4]NRA77553.1 hypothetical protein [Pseudoalteromonas sp.]
MKYPTKTDVQKLGLFIRILASIIFTCSLFGALGLTFALFTEKFEFGFLIGFTVIGIMLHISGSVTFKGYAPKYLLFTHGPK